MATETFTRLVDDLDGTEATSTVTYSWKGQAYEIDLSDKNAEEFQEAIAPYISASRKAGRSASAASDKTAKAKGGGVDVKAVRAWAQENGVEVSPRGRVSGAVIEQYMADQGA